MLTAKPVFWLGKTTTTCLVIPVVNEGARIANLLKRMRDQSAAALTDIIIIDGGSTDGSLEPEMLKSLGVRGLLLKTGPGRLSAQLRCAYAFALDNGYEGIVTIDGNDKDDPEAIPRFVAKLAASIGRIRRRVFARIAGACSPTPELRSSAISSPTMSCLRICRIARRGWAFAASRYQRRGVIR